jgi:hypothetical protein
MRVCEPHQKTRFLFSNSGQVEGWWEVGGWAGPLERCGRLNARARLHHATAPITSAIPHSGRSNRRWFARPVRRDGAHTASRMADPVSDASVRAMAETIEAAVAEGFAGVVRVVPIARARAVRRASSVDPAANTAASASPSNSSVTLSDLGHRRSGWCSFDQSFLRGARPPLRKAQRLSSSSIHCRSSPTISGSAKSEGRSSQLPAG